jgi:pyrroloquinoline-quinone synthase
MNTLFPEAFAQYNLLDHPFYLAWNKGTLTREQLAEYAVQYGQFIRLISEGWQKIGEPGIAKEEQEHYELWKQFGKSLQAEMNTSSFPEINELVNAVQKNNASYAGALGALYAFERQQPATAASKLDGLKKHYQRWNADETYFTIHASDFEEPALLEEKYHSLSISDKKVAEDACQQTCSLLWNALTGISEHAGVECMLN